MSSEANKKFRSWRFIQLPKGCDQIFPTNKITTGHYTLSNLLPKNLFEQFHRISIIWFFIVSAMQISALNVDPDTRWNTVSPLLFILLLTLFKDAYHDWKRHRNDTELNSMTYSVWNGRDFVQTASRDIKVGDFLFLQDRMLVPADILVIASGHADHICYVDLMNFHGSPNLAIKQAIKETQQMISTLSSEEATRMISTLKGDIKVSEPSPDFHHLEAFIKLPRSPKTTAITTENLVLRESVLHTTPWIIGLVVYTGLETKVYLNNISAKKKVGRIEHRISIWVSVILICLLFLVLLLSLLNQFLSKQSNNFFTIFVGYFLLLKAIVPISLFVTIDIVRLCQAYFVQVDAQLQGNVDFKTGDINEELGQVEYVFMNTAGLMASARSELSVMIIGEDEFWKTIEEGGSPEAVAPPAFSKQQSRDFDRVEGDLISTETYGHLFSEEARTLITEPYPQMQTFKRLQDICSTFRPANFEDYFECLTLCNNVVVMDNSTYFSAWREDELFVQSARDLGCVLEARSEYECHVNVFGRPTIYNIIAFSEYKNTTKRTRIILQRTDEETGVFYVKGSLSTMANILDSNMIDYKRIEKVVVGLNKRGIRTQILAKKMILEDTLKAMKDKFQSAKLAVAHVESKVDAVFQELEDLEEVTYLGIIGFEDNVTEDSKDVVKSCYQAGIKMWLMSGDPESTTLSIAYKIGLLDPDQSILHLKSITNGETLVEELERSIKQYIGQDEFYKDFSRNNSYISDEGVSHEVHTSHGYNILKRIQGATNMLSARKRDLSYDPARISYCLSIDGVTFSTAMSNKESRQLLSYLLFCAHSVCCNMFLPLQKSLAVKLVKENFIFHPVTLAIGRTGSATSMLQEADVGIGIQSRDTYANFASDIMIQHFGLLSPLLFKHGQWNYVRMSKTVLLFFFRSFFSITIFAFFSILNHYQVVSLFDVDQSMTYWFLFTLLPIGYLAVFNQHITAEDIAKIPTTYQDGQFQRSLSWRLLLRYIGLAITQGLMLCGFVYIACVPVLNSLGQTETRETFTVLFLILMVIVANVQTVVDTDHFTWLFAGVNSTSCILLVGYLVIINYVPESESFGVLAEIFSSGELVSLLFLAPAACFVVSYGFRSYSRVFHPTIVEKLRLGKVATSPAGPSRTFPRLEAFKNHLQHVYRSTSLFSNIIDDDGYQLSPFSLRFISKNIETEYQMKYLSTHLQLLRGLSLCGCVISLAWTILDVLTIDPEEWFLVLRIVCIVVGLCLVAGTYTNFFQQHFEIVAIAVMAGIVILIGTVPLILLDNGGMAAALVPMLTFLIVQINFVWVVAVNCLNIILFTIVTVSYFADEEQGMAAVFILTYEALLIGFTLITGHAGYLMQRTNRLGYKLRYSTEKEVEKSRQILSLLLPAFVLSKVIDREDDKFIAEDQGQVTIIFCDIYDFDSICNMYKPHELTAFLDELFQHFDDLCPVNGVVKVETVGKTYMASSGLKYIDSELPPELSSISHARRAVDFAFSILRTISSYRLKSGDPLHMKIGINSGYVISGVVGKHKPQFSLVGDAVNTASRMCSTIESVNTIQISEKTKEMMAEKHGCLFEPRTIWAKGKGDMNTFLVSEEMGEDGKTLPGLFSVTTAKRHVIRNASSAQIGRRVQTEQLLELSPSPVPSAAQPSVVSFWPLCGDAESDENRSFRLEVARISHPIFNSGMVISTIVNGIIAAMRLVQYYEYPSYTCLPSTVAYFIMAATSFSSLFIPKRLFMNRVFALIWIPVACLALVLPLLDIIFQTAYDTDLVMIPVMGHQVIAAWNGTHFAKMICVFSIYYSVAWLVVGARTLDWNYHAMYFLFLFFFGLINCWTLLVREKLLRQFFALKKVEEREIEKNEKLLNQMMPKLVYERLKQDILVTDKHRSITLLYADIVGFTNWSSDKTPQQVIGMLSALFTQFDMLCVDYKVYKVHTIGDCYVIMGYNGETETRDPSMECLRVLCMGHSMIEVIQEVNRRENISLNMRIGIHTGEVIAGITGKDVVRYDIYGPAVLVANKMESNGTPGKVNVSEVAKDLLERVAQGLLEYEDNKMIEVGSIGMKYMSYFVKVLDSGQLRQLITD